MGLLQDKLSKFRLPQLYMERGVYPYFREIDIYNDNTCPPTTVTAALNVITAPKTIVVTPVSAHWRFEETNRKSIEWMKKRIN